MTAADKKIILEYGSDYVLRLKIKADDGINDRDMRGWTWKFDVYSSSGVKNDLYSIGGSFAAKINIDVSVALATAIGELGMLEEGTTTYNNKLAEVVILQDELRILNGEVDILIDSAHINTIPTGAPTTDAFATQYNYFYTITVIEPGAGTVGVRSMRLLRGKLAVRL